MKIYGIKNCDTMKKARKWLADNQLDVEFHDYKKDGLSPELLTSLVSNIGWESLVNKRGTTYRKLDDNVKDNLDEASAIKVMLDNPSIIKRPILEKENQYLLGFKAELYQDFV
jgi:Spx/MgsR family transcriptional regulator